jgi:hypothetical protein
LTEKITLEKCRLEEVEEQVRLRQAEQGRNFMQKELEATEQKETMAKFELSELKKVHEDLTLSLANMQKANDDLVNPILTQLKKEVLMRSFQ